MATLTDQEKRELKQEIINQLKSESQSVDELPKVSSLDGITSLPAMRGTEVVEAPLTLLSKPATDAASQALAAKKSAEDAAKTATNAAGEALAKATVANDAAQEALAAKEETETATAEALVVITQHESIALAAQKGATARFDGILEDASVAMVSFTNITGVFYVIKKKIFVGKSGTAYCNNWPGADMYFNETRSSIKKDKLYLMGSTLYAWSDEEDCLVEASGTGGGNTINVTEEYPLESGYYTLASAIKAVEEKKRAKGRCITFEASQGKYITKQFVGTNVENWESEASWDDFGGGGTVKSVTLNGQKSMPDSQGNINLTFNEVEVDESLDASSTNPVQNSAVTARMSELDASTVFGLDAELSDDESTVHLSIKNKSGAEIAGADIPAGGGGGGGGDTSTAKIVLGASASQNIIKEGGECMLTYTYDHQYSSGDDAGQTTGQKASIEIRVQRGSILVYSDTISDVSKGTYTLDLQKYLQVGMTDVYVKATATDPNTGKQQSKQAYVNVKVVNLSLSCGYNLASGISGGGYGPTESAIIPFTIQGTGAKTVFLYLDGVQKFSTTVTRSGTTNGSFTVPMTGLAVGRHTVQLVADMEASSELTLRSESWYMDIFKAGDSIPYIGTMHCFADGRIFTTNHKTPRVQVGQYEQLTFDYVVFDAGGTPASLTMYQNGAAVQNVSVPRSVQTYANRFTEQGAQQMKLVCGATEYPFYIDVAKSSIDVSEATFGLMLKLSASGRSNGEADPAHWEYENVKTIFRGVDWKTSGWTGDALKLMNGASAEIQTNLFTADAATNGFTVEFEYRVSNITDRNANVISCLDGTKGFQITAEKAMMYTGSTKEVTDEDGNSTTQPVGVGRQYGSDMWVKAAFVIGKRSEGRKMELYINGTRSAADIYGESDNFMQTNPVGVSIESEGADVEVRIVRVYNRALTDDEETDNHIVDRQSLDEMARLFEENDVLGEDGRSIDFEKLRKKGKAVMLVIRQGGLAPVNAENNKKTDFLSDVHIWTPDGRYIYLHNVYVRIQGTSSTKYPTKNYRIYCNKGENPELYINGVKQEELKVALRPGQKAVSILCPKADYSDSSMVQNTGGAKIYTKLMKALGFLTPPQMKDSNVRVSIDGYPIDVFSAESMEDTPVYYGQYNLNHDKSDWQEIIGLEGVEGFTPECPMAFEFLNNTQPLCLFQAQADIDAQATAEFDNALEFNYPADTKWKDATATQKTAFKRLWGWVRDCVPAGATPSNLNTFVSAKFKSEVQQYFDKNFLLVWFLFTDYFANFDQRVKNMILTTWDALVWYFIYYDGDTQIGDRNDSFLAYLYDVSRDTWDAEKSKYAFEGHDSWLWCLVLANMQDELKAMATKIREKLTEEDVNDIFDNEQQGNWCARAYNKSGELKYIIPQTEGVIVKGQMVKYPYIYALKGDKQAFRHWFLSNRFALLDAKYETGNYLSDNIDMYMSRAATAAANTIVITSNELYYFGYGTNNAPHLQPSEKADRGETVTLRFLNAFTVNDPIRIYGARRIAELDMRGSSDNLTGDLNLNKCKVLRKLNLSTTGTGSNGWCLVIDQCLQLVDVNLYGQANAKTGTLSSTELDFTNQTRLQSVDARGVNVQAVLFAQGCPVKTAKLGSQIQTLRLEYLPELTESGLTLQNWRTVKTLRFSNCPHISWQTILNKCTSVDRVRIEGISLEDDGTMLNKYKTLKGIDADGNAVDYCAFVGNVRLTTYIEDEEFEQLQSRFPELNIQQPDYSILEFDDSVSDDANVSNLDNKTGYKYGSDFVPSGHVKAILKRRFRCLSKITKKPTTRNITHAGVQTIANNLDGEATIFPLHDANSNYYADAADVKNCTSAKLDGSEGDWMMYEPHRWYKGINDYMNQKHYCCFSSNTAMPRVPEATIVTLDQIKDAGDYRNNYKVMSGKDTLANSYSSDSNYAVCRVGVSGFKKVRFPSVPGTNLVGSVFTDASGKVVGSVVVSTLGLRFVAGMYLVADVPANATALNFSVLKSAEFDKVVLSNSTKIEDLEPEWVEENEHLCGVVGSSVVGDKLRACITGGSTTANMTWTDFHYYSVLRGMQQIDGLMHNNIANLFYAKYGRRDSQMQCGAGQHTYSRTTGGTAKLGMQDTVNTDGKTVGGIEGNGLAFYKETNSDGESVFTRINNTNCLGYEDIYGNKYDMMDGVDVPNGNRKWHYMMPDGTERWVQGGSADGWITAVANGLYMDMTPVAVNGSSTTYYCDYYWQSGSASRVVYRGYYSAYAYGGVSFAYASYDASYAYASVGSRLAFRGKIVKAQSVSAFKSKNEVA